MYPRSVNACSVVLLTPMVRRTCHTGLDWSGYSAIGAEHLEDDEVVVAIEFQSHPKRGTRSDRGLDVMRNDHHPSVVAHVFLRPHLQFSPWGGQIPHQRAIGVLGDVVVDGVVSAGDHDLIGGQYRLGFREVVQPQPKPCLEFGWMNHDQNNLKIIRSRSFANLNVCQRYTLDGLLFRTGSQCMTTATHDVKFWAIQAAISALNSYIRMSHRDILSVVMHVSFTA